MLMPKNWLCGISPWAQNNLNLKLATAISK